MKLPLAQRLGDRLNPILVKEVRQALRGQYFRNVFWFTLVAATLIGCALLMRAYSEDLGEDLGISFFTGIFGVLSVAVHAFVPFWAFLNTGGEWDENTYDLLVISDLRPLQLVLGKLLAGLVLTLLFYSAFGPFLVSTILMPGVDLPGLAVVLAGSLVLAASLTIVAIALSSLSRSRPVRILLMALLALILLYATVGSIGVGAMMVRAPEVLRDGNTLVGLLVLFASIAFVGLLSLAVATARFAHEEENRSSGLRAAVLAIGVAALASAWSLGRGFAMRDTLIPILGGLLLTIVPLAFFVTESEPLGRRVRKHVPKSGLLAALVTPLLPGGGRGMLFFLVFAAQMQAGLLLVTSRGSLTGMNVAFGQSLGVLFAYAMIYLGLPSALAAGRVHTARGRAALRITIPLVFVVGFFVPALLGLFFGLDDWVQFRHPGNPAWVVLTIAEGGSGSRAAWLYTAILLPLAVLCFILNVPRMVRGFTEVQSASAERRAREERAVAAATA